MAKEKQILKVYERIQKLNFVSFPGGTLQHFTVKKPVTGYLDYLKQRSPQQESSGEEGWACNSG